MKKTVFSIFGATAIGAVALISANIGLRGESLSDITLANIEALASNEGGGDGSTDCYDTITTATAQSVVYCGTCTSIPGKPSTYASLKKC